jgi:hypothetical protein
MKLRRVAPLAAVLAAVGVVFMWPASQPPAPSSAVTTTAVPFIAGVYGAAWEVVSDAPVAGREQIAVTEVDDGRIFVFGGTTGGYRDENLPPSVYIQDGWIYNPVDDSWSFLPPPHFDMCDLADPVAIAGGFWAPVVLWGRVDLAAEPGCVPAAAFDPVSLTWRPLGGEFFERLSPHLLVSYEEIPLGDPVLPPAGRLVAPDIGLYFDLVSGATGSLDSGGATVMQTSRTASSTWTGEWHLTVDRGLLFGWQRAADSWHFDLGGTPIAADGQGIAATDLGAFLVNGRLEAAVIDNPESMLWSFVDSVPLRASACSPEVLSVGGKPLVHTCVGVAIYEAAGGGWIPFSPPIGLDGTMLATSDTLYWFSGQVSRLEFAPDGVIAPRRLPIGLTDVELPEGYHFAGSIGLVQTMDADGRVIAEVHGFEVSEPSGGICTVVGLYRPVGDLPEPVGVISVERPVLPPLEVLDYSQGGATRLVVETAPRDSVEVRCGHYEDALALVGALQWIEV